MTALMPTVLREHNVQHLLEGRQLPTRLELPVPKSPGLYLATVPVKSAADALGLQEGLLSAHQDIRSMFAYPKVLADVELMVSLRRRLYR